MASTKIEITGVEGLQSSLDALAKRYSKATVDAAITAGQLVRGDAIKSIQDVSDGAHEVRTNAAGNQRQVVVSKPGDAPNTDSGRLVSSIQLDIGNKFVFVGTSLPYGAWLEYGTRYMNARPWLYPALERNRNAILKQFKIKIDAVTQKGLK